jgi:ribonuclease R
MNNGGLQNKDTSAAKNAVEGVISISSKGVGYVRVEGEEEDIEIQSPFLNTALHGDRVKAIPHPRRAGRQLSGEILEVLVRAKPGFAGTLELDKGMHFLVPQDTRMYTDILIPKENLNGAKEGDKVFGVIVSWADPKKSPEGEITEVLGKPNENNAEMRAIALERGFSSNFPDTVEQEASRLKERGIRPEDLAERKDLRNITTFTIDPEDAKDFDDAISFENLPDGNYEIGVHIADVSNYVRPGSSLDQEAIKRGTSVYLVDRTIPMLPEKLSNDLCSLNPNEDKLSMSAVFVMNDKAEVLKNWFGKTVINSNKRFTYEDAQSTLDEKTGDYYEELNILNTLAKKLTQKRFDEGAISMEQEEVKFVLDENGVPIKVYKKIRGDTHKLVEEFMLLANRSVAKYVADRAKRNGKENVFVYRVHGTPNQEKVANLAFFLKSVGYELKLHDGDIAPNELNRLLTSLEGKTEKDMIQTAVVRSMAKAVYSTENIGHYGLAFEYYTHFTSPIRRYPDVMVHRLLEDYLHNKEVSEKEWHIYDTLCNYSSQREKEASDAERASVKYKQVEYMSSRVGQTFDGVISGVTEWGLYVEEKETKCEGMVKLRDIGDDFYNFDEKHYRVVGERTKRTFTLGDKVRFTVVAADMVRKTLDYKFV